MVTQNEPVGGPTLRTSNGFFHPSTDLDREEVRDELRKILESPVFHSSKRYAEVLKFIVDQTLAGCGNQLKERTIGIEVFHRTPDYDTAADHAVRSAVAEVRKRLAQYYQQSTCGQYRIEVLPGSYMPQFRRATERPIQIRSGPDSVSEPPERAAPATLKRPGRSRWLGSKRLAVGCAILVTSVAVLVVYVRPRDTFESFWWPILSSRSPVLLCIGNVQGGLGPQGEKLIPSPTLTLSDYQNSAMETVSAHDAITAAKFAGLMEANGQRYEFKSQSDATFTDLQRGPFVLVGLLNNSWTRRLVPKLRFTVEQTSTIVRIRDSNNPSRQDWSVDYSTPYLDITRDYALVLRVLDPKTEQIVVVDAGITVFGTFAAGDFLTNKDEMKKLAAIAPPGWEKKNMEIVLSTDVIRGRSGPATIVASQFW